MEKVRKNGSFSMLSLPKNPTQASGIHSVNVRKVAKNDEIISDELVSIGSMDELFQLLEEAYESSLAGHPYAVIMHSNVFRAGKVEISHEEIHGGPGMYSMEEYVGAILNRDVDMSSFLYEKIDGTCVFYGCEYPTEPNVNVQTIDWLDEENSYSLKVVTYAELKLTLYNILWDMVYRRIRHATITSSLLLDGKLDIPHNNLAGKFTEEWMVWDTVEGILSSAVNMGLLCKADSVYVYSISSNPKEEPTLGRHLWKSEAIYELSEDDISTFIRPGDDVEIYIGRDNVDGNPFYSLKYTAGLIMLADIYGNKREYDIDCSNTMASVVRGLLTRIFR